jgi:acyl carrier protein
VKTTEGLTQALDSSAAKFDQLSVHQKGDLQKILVETIAELLKVKPSEVDIAKNFDEYGLDSIDAVIATDWIGKRLGIVLPPEFLFANRSIDAVIDALFSGDHRRESRPSRSVTQTPIFLCGGGGGVDGPGLIHFREQAVPHLVFDLVPMGRWYDWLNKGLRFEDLAMSAAQYIHEKLPQGPISLAGYSQGGQLAYVTALELENMGRTVEFLCLLDSDSKAVYPTSTTKPGIVLGALSLCRRYIVEKIRGGNLFPSRHKLFHFAGWLWEQRGGPQLVMMGLRIKRAVLPGGSRARGDDFIQMRIFAKMWSDWTEENEKRILYKTRVFLFRSEEPGPPDLGWRARCLNITVVPIKGDHYSILSSERLIGQLVAEVGTPKQ